MNRNLTTIFISASIFLALAILGGLVWVNAIYARLHPGEKDFLVPWLAARTFLQYGDSPYSEPATQRAQIVYYGRLAQEGEDPLRLDLPFPIEILYFPLAGITDYPLARGLWMVLLEAALVGLAFLTLRLTGWKPARRLLPVVLVFSVLWVYGLLALVSASGAVFVMLALVGMLLSLRAERDELAGALLLLVTLKPAMTGLFLLLILGWLVAYRRWRVFGGFMMVLVLLTAISFLFLPDWLLPFLRGVYSHYVNNPGLTPGAIFAAWWPAIGTKIGWLLSAGVVALLIFEWRLVRENDARRFLWTISLTLTATPLLGIPVSPVDLLVLFIPLILFVTVLEDRWPRPGHWGIGGVFIVGLFFLQLILVLSAAFGGSDESLQAVILLPLPFFLLACLYWMRWWGVYPPRTWLETLKKETG